MMAHCLDVPFGLSLLLQQGTPLLSTLTMLTVLMLHGFVHEALDVHSLA
jgi:hypothetical protein